MSATVKLTSAIVAASMAITAAASYSAALSQSLNQDDEDRDMKEKEVEQQPLRRPPEDKFAPRFDGLRFIETLISAHR